jgi:hypothetical protein
LWLLAARLSAGVLASAIGGMDRMGLSTTYVAAWFCCLNDLFTIHYFVLLPSSP